MIKIVAMLILGILLFVYGINLLNNLKEDDKDKNLKRFGYSIVITIGIVLVGTSFYEMVLYNRLNPIRRPRAELPVLPRFSPFSSPINRTANV
jgi:hypothetical protein